MKATVKKTSTPSLAAVVDQLYRLRVRRLELQRQVELLQKEETALKDRLVRELPADQATGIAGRVARASITVREVPTVSDWDALLSHVGVTRDFSLLQRRVNAARVHELWDEHHVVPGVESFRLVTVSLVKL